MRKIFLLFALLTVALTAKLLAFDPPPNPGGGVPEPMSMALIGVGGAAMYVANKFKNRK